MKYERKCAVVCEVCEDTFYSSAEKVSDALAEALEYGWHGIEQLGDTRGAPTLTLATVEKPDRVIGRGSDVSGTRASNVAVTCAGCLPVALAHVVRRIEPPAVIARIAQLEAELADLKAQVAS